MSDDPADALQVAIRAALLADSRVQAAFGTSSVAVWDTVPVDGAGRVLTGAFPYITLGDGDQVIGQDTSCGPLSEVYVQINVWSRKTDGAEVRGIAAAVRHALQNPLDLDGHTQVTRRFESALYRREPDGLTRRAVLTFRFDTAPNL